MTNYYSYEEAMEKVNQSAENRVFRTGILLGFELRELFPDNLFFVENIDEELSGYYAIYGFYYLKIKNSYLMFPLDEDERIRVKSIEKMDEKWMDILKNSLNRYERLEKRIKDAKDGINQLLESQKIRMLFKK